MKKKEYSETKGLVARFNIQREFKSSLTTLPNIPLSGNLTEDKELLSFHPPPSKFSAEF